MSSCNQTHKYSIIYIRYLLLHSSLTHIIIESIDFSSFIHLHSRACLQHANSFNNGNINRISSKLLILLRQGLEIRTKILESGKYTWNYKSRLAVRPFLDFWRIIVDFQQRKSSTVERRFKRRRYKRKVNLRQYCRATGHFNYVMKSQFMRKKSI